MQAIARDLLLAWGSLLLCFGIYQLTLPRASYVSSSPAAGESLSTPPAMLTIRFGRALVSESWASVRRTWTREGAPDRAGERTRRSSGPDPADPTGRTLKVDLGPDLGRGIYRVDWHVVASGGAPRYGSFYFAVGIPLPRDLTRSDGGP